MSDNRPVNKRTGEVKDIPLADDLADVLSHMVVGWEPLLGHDLAQHPDVVRVMARYRESKRIDYAPQFDEHDEPLRHEGGWVLPGDDVSSNQCRKCGGPIDPSQYRFGSPATGWEHMAGDCPARKYSDVRVTEITDT